eukprot:CAMPEP_0204560866 /NCGR_PEP_ID=MMETSP0661-20131031/32862_1 /ASSEMBLY_ACC=CAM_ASM_000606 /TAXON_ID=109239 /ORGANISM="Alexandrium margalefi, Strain AMGDE01CS-322" /LENGTH=323 /DNA_ID=CAMNT_0051568227 /DNA_START=42 /DNA_END=1013 /DNA_ORIENTATION=+
MTRADALWSLSRRLGYAARHSKAQLGEHDTICFLSPLFDVLQDLGDEMKPRIGSPSVQLRSASSEIRMEISVLQALAVRGYSATPSASAAAVAQRKCRFADRDEVLEFAVPALPRDAPHDAHRPGDGATLEDDTAKSRKTALTETRVRAIVQAFPVAAFPMTFCFDLIVLLVMLTAAIVHALPVAAIQKKSRLHLAASLEMLTAVQAFPVAAFKMRSRIHLAALLVRLAAVIVLAFSVAAIKKKFRSHVMVLPVMLTAVPMPAWVLSPPYPNSASFDDMFACCMAVADEVLSSEYDGRHGFDELGHECQQVLLQHGLRSYVDD